MITENIVVNTNLNWVDIEHPLKRDCSFLFQEYGLPQLLVQDFLQPEQLPKFERTKDGYFFLLRVYDPWDNSQHISIPKLSNKLAIFIHKNNEVVTMHNDVIFPLKRYIEMDRNLLPKTGKDLAHELIRLAVTSFEDGLSEVQGDYESFEKEILSEEVRPLSNKRVYEFRRKLFVLKGILQITQRMLYNSRDFWQGELHLLQDIRENIDQLFFRLEGLSQNFDQLFSLHISINERKSNEVMKVLTLFASIMLPLTFISSFYGMNFEHLPGIHSNEGFVGALLIMITTTFITVWFFARKHWFNSSM
ncbi:MAG: CorA family divalent cation transporter [Bacteriovoracia bacterium]